MKLVLAVVQAKDADACVSALLTAGHTCTRLSSFGGFLDRENVTLLIAVGDEEVEAAITLLSNRARRRSETVEPPPGSRRRHAMEVEVGGATIVVLPVERVEKI